MKNQKGITLTSVVIYIIVLMILIATFAVIRGNFQNEIKEISNNSNLEAEFNKFNIYFLKEINTAGNDISEIKENEITFSLTGNKYAFSIPMKQINLISENNKVITILENVNSCNFELKTNEGKKTIVATISFEKDIDHPLSKEYTLVENVESRVYQDESDYITTRLPKEYQEVEYIESTGIQYIDTGVKAENNEVLCDMDIAILDGTYFIGAGKSTEIQGEGVAFGKYQNTWSDLNAGVTYNEFGVWTNSRVQFSWNLTNGRSDITGYNSKTTYSDAHYGYNCEWRNYNFCIGKPAVTTIHNSSFRVYSLAITKENSLVREFVPCYRKSDGEIGLYDLVENEFYTNAGTGTFLKGEDV